MLAPRLMHAIAPDDDRRHPEEAAARERAPLLVAEPLERFLDEHGLGCGPIEASRSARATRTSPT